MRNFQMQAIFFGNYPHSNIFFEENVAANSFFNIFLTIFLALNFCSLTDCQKLWHNCFLFVNTSFDTN